MFELKKQLSNSQTALKVPGSGADHLRARPDPGSPPPRAISRVSLRQADWNGSVDPTPPKPFFACIQLPPRHANAVPTTTAGIQPLHTATRRAGRPEGLSGRGCRAPRGWRCCCARRGRPRCSTARWAPTGPPTSHARGPRRPPPPPRRRWVRGSADLCGRAGGFRHGGYADSKILVLDPKISTASIKLGLRSRCSYFA